MKLILKDMIGIAKELLGILSIFLILCGIHWMVVLSGVMLGASYFAIPKKYLS
jgi:hypothetical protein